MPTIDETGNQLQRTWALSGLGLFALWSFFLLCRPQDYLVSLAIIRPSLSLGLLTLFIYLLKGKQFNQAEKQYKLYKYLVMVMILSIPLSYYPRAALSGLIHYGIVIMFVYLFYKYIGHIAQIRSVIFIYCIGISVYAIFTLIRGSINVGRLSFGTMFDPNDIAFYMISFLTFNLIFITRNNSMSVRIIAISNLLISVLIILKTGSRGGFVALIAVIGYLLFKTSIFKANLVTKVLLVLVAAFSLQFVSFHERFKTITDYKEDYNITSEEGRLAIWKTGMKLMFTHPLTGVGFNNFPEGIGRDRESRGLSSSRWQTAHNSLVQIGAETGIIGFILFLTLSLNAYRVFFLASLQSGSFELARIGDMAKAGFFGHFIAAMFLSQAYSVYWAFYIVLSAVLNRMLIKAEETAPVRAEHKITRGGVLNPRLLPGQ